MRPTRVLAACAALALTFAACGDDDDDTGGDTAPATNAPAGGATTTAAAGGATTAAAGEPAATAAGDATAPAAAPADDPEIAADCQALQGAAAAFADSDVAQPEVGDELTDEYKDFVRQNIETLEDVDLETDAVESARDEALEFGEEVLDSDTWTEDLDTRSGTAFQALGEVCLPYFAAAASVPG